MLIVDGKLLSDSGGRFKFGHTVEATDKGSNFLNMVTSEEVVVTKTGCNNSMSVAYCKVDNFEDKLSMELEICSIFKFWAKGMIFWIR